MFQLFFTNVVFSFVQTQNDLETVDHNKTVFFNELSSSTKTYSDVLLEQSCTKRNGSCI